MGKGKGAKKREYLIFLTQCGQGWVPTDKFNPALKACTHNSISHSYAFTEYLNPYPPMLSGYWCMSVSNVTIAGSRMQS